MSQSAKLVKFQAPSVVETAEPPAFAGFLDVSVPTTVLLGTGTITVRRCLALQRDSVLKLDQSAGADMFVMINGVRIARGEVVIVEDSIAVRLTTFAKSTSQESAA
ncbi:MAG: FliM/FliN family flagellar motor switch protein [Vicinamibacterales bacterium]